MIRVTPSTLYAGRPDGVAERTAPGEPFRTALRAAGAGRDAAAPGAAETATVNARVAGAPGKKRVADEAQQQTAQLAARAQVAAPGDPGADDDLAPLATGADDAGIAATGEASEPGVAHAGHDQLVEDPGDTVYADRGACAIYSASMAAAYAASAGVAPRVSGELATGPAAPGPRDLVASGIAQGIASGIAPGIPPTSGALGVADPGLAAAAAAQSAPPGSTDVDSPVAAWRAAAVGRAIGSLGAHAAHATAPAQAAAPAAPTQAPDAATASSTALSSAFTPLEQAVQDLLDQVGDRDLVHPRPGKPGAASGTGSTGATPVLEPTLPRATQATDRDAGPRAPGHAAPIQPPEPPANPSHVHLVLDDGPERVVATVAVRGNDVHVALRASDDATAAALARNVGSLDHAMRARGLALGELTTDRDPHDRAPSQHSQHSQHSGSPDQSGHGHPGARDPRDPEPRERNTPHAEPFVLEDEP